MKHRPKKNTVAEQRYSRDLERTGPLEKVESGQASILAPPDYPEPIKRFLARERDLIRVKLSATARKRLDQLSRATGIPVTELARRWVEQGLAREAG